MLDRMAPAGRGISVYGKIRVHGLVTCCKHVYFMSRVVVADRGMDGGWSAGGSSPHWFLVVTKNYMYHSSSMMLDADGLFDASRPPENEAYHHCNGQRAITA
jgi:hypothetical protein